MNRNIVELAKQILNESATRSSEPKEDSKLKALKTKVFQDKKTLKQLQTKRKALVGDRSDGASDKRDALERQIDTAKNNLFNSRLRMDHHRHNVKVQSLKAKNKPNSRK